MPENPSHQPPVTPGKEPIIYMVGSFYFAFIWFRVQGSGFRWRLRRLFLEDGILASQPSPLGEGAPKERIGHWRYERQLRKAERCAAYVGGA